MTYAHLSIGLSLAAILALTACSKPKTPEGEAAAADATAKPVTVAEAMPMQKPGLWAINTQVPEMPQALETKLCVDQALSTRLVEVGMKGVEKGDCGTSEIVRTGNTIVADATCTKNGRTTSSHIEMVVVSDSEYRQTITSTTEPPKSGDGKTTITITGKRTGDCPSDMAGGDMLVMGVKVNMKDALDKAEAAKH